MNLELGFKRLSWVISAPGLIVAAIGLVGIFVDPLAQAVVGCLIGGPIWFGFTWVAFFTLRWIIRGFQGKGK